MRVLTVYAHPNPKSFCLAILEQFTKGLEDAGHVSEVVDLYAIQEEGARSNRFPAIPADRGEGRQ